MKNVNKSHFSIKAAFVPWVLKFIKVIIFIQFENFDILPILSNVLSHFLLINFLLKQLLPTWPAQFLIDSSNKIENRLWTIQVEMLIQFENFKILLTPSNVLSHFALMNFLLGQLFPTWPAQFLIDSSNKGENGCMNDPGCNFHSICKFQNSTYS